MPGPTIQSQVVRQLSLWTPPGSAQAVPITWHNTIHLGTGCDIEVPHSFLHTKRKLTSLVWWRSDGDNRRGQWWCDVNTINLIALMFLIVWIIVMVMVMMMMVMMVMAMMMIHETDWADGTCGESDALGTARPFPFHHRWTVLPFVEVVLALALYWCCFHLPLSWIRNQPLATSPNIEPCATTSHLQITWKLSPTVSSCLGIPTPFSPDEEPD